MQPSDIAKAAHAEIVRTWGARPKVFRHGDVNEQHFINVASLPDPSLGNSINVATCGLSDHLLGMDPIRVELIGAFPVSVEEAPNIAATCAFNVFKHGFEARPSAVHRGVVQMYVPDTTVPHILLTDPFLWPDGPRTLDLGETKTAWLMMVPIAESELKFAEVNGFGELARLMETQDVQILDLYRRAVA